MLPRLCRALTTSVAAGSALQRQQLEFCCLLCGWDVPCRTCPFQWFGFDARRARRRVDGQPLAQREDVRRAMKTLALAPTQTQSLSRQQVKAAFRAKALEWHPDCSEHPEAERVFKDVVRAYELLLAIAS